MKKILTNTLSVIIIVSSLLCLVSCGSRYKYAEIKTDLGSIILKLDTENAPITVENFISLADSGFYDGLTFHRAQKHALIQGGDPKGNGSGNSGKPIKGEFPSNGVDNKLSHVRGVISMARSKDPDSASCQFFICNADVTSLDGDYAAFGYVISGMSVVDAITEAMAPYGDYYYGTVYDKSLHVKIISIRSITESEALRS